MIPHRFKAALNQLRRAFHALHRLPQRLHLAIDRDAIREIRLGAGEGRLELLCQNIVSCSSTLVKKECLLRHPMKDDRMIHEDLAAWLAVLDETPYAVGVDEPLLLYRVSKSGKSGNKFKAAKMQWRTYRAANVPFFTAAISFLRYAVRGVVKYASI